MAQEEEYRGFQKGDLALIRRFAGYLHDQRGTILLALFAMACAGAAQVAGPYLVKLGIDRHILPGNLSGLWFIVALYMATLLVVFAATFVQTTAIGRAGQNICLKLRDQLYAHLGRLPLRFYDTQPVGRTVTRLTNDVEALSELVSSGVVAILSDILLLTGIAVMMFWMNPTIALMAFLFLPILAKNFIYMN